METSSQTITKQSVWLNSKRYDFIKSQQKKAHFLMTFATNTLPFDFGRSVEGFSLGLFMETKLKVSYLTLAKTLTSR